MAVRDNVNRIRENIHTDIPSQFPAVYQEDGALFVEFIKAYYEYVDSELPKFRDGFYARNVDTADFDKFLLFYKDKYMADMPYEGSVDLRFIIKHITDFYRRKGTEESLRLFFRMFFDEEVELFYPASSILKPSDSKFGSDTYLEMRPVTTVFDYPITRGSKIRGDTSKTEAFVDEIIFKNFNGALTPILFISGVNGKFITDDGIEVTKSDQTVNVGKLIKGNITKLTVLEPNRISGNEIGDKVKLKSNMFGIEGKGIVTGIADTTTGIIEFKVEDGGYGYAITKDGQTAEDLGVDLNEHYISNQVLVVSSTSDYDLQAFDTLTFSDADVFNSDGTVTPGYSSINTSVTFLKQDNTLLYTIAPDDTIPVIPVDSYFEGVNDRTGETIRIVQSAEYNPQAQFRVASIKNSETVTLIPDIIGDFVDVQLDALDYGMSGSGSETLSTTLRDAFTPNTWEIGEIDKITILNSGIGYKNDVVTIMKQPEISNFDYREIGMSFDRVDFLLEVGDIVSQIIQIEDLTYAQPTVPYVVKLEFLRRVKDVFYFRPRSFYQIDPDLQLTIKGDTYTITKIFEADETDQMGQNALISGRAYFASGQISDIKVTETGYRYTDGETVEIINDEADSANYGKYVASADIETRGMGYTEGVWKTTNSFLNESTKVIRDNYYYQEYSYDISSIVNPENYETLIREEVAPAGTKLFSSPLINSFNTFEADVDIVMEIYTLNDILYADENGALRDSIAARTSHGANQGLIPGLWDEIVARDANLVVDETEALQEQINS